MRSRKAAKLKEISKSAVQSPDVDRVRRLEVLMGTFGMWKGKGDMPQDGLQYQLEARAEWD